MAAEAEASREARAKVIAADGEMRASRALKEASSVIDQSPSALQLRYLQVSVEGAFLPCEKKSDNKGAMDIRLFGFYLQGNGLISTRPDVATMHGTSARNVMDVGYVLCVPPSIVPHVGWSRGRRKDAS